MEGRDNGRTSALPTKASVRGTGECESDSLSRVVPGGTRSWARPKIPSVALETSGDAAVLGAIKVGLEGVGLNTGSISTHLGESKEIGFIPR